MRGFFMQTFALPFLADKQLPALQPVPATAPFYYAIRDIFFQPVILFTA